jgi:hypothetical protein
MRMTAWATPTWEFCTQQDDHGRRAALGRRRRTAARRPGREPGQLCLGTGSNPRRCAARLAATIALMADGEADWPGWLASWDRQQEHLRPGDCGSASAEWAVNVHPSRAPSPTQNRLVTPSKPSMLTHLLIQRWLARAAASSAQRPSCAQANDQSWCGGAAFRGAGIPPGKGPAAAQRPQQQVPYPRYAQAAKPAQGPTARARR